jgi:hypothetical protein
MTGPNNVSIVFRMVFEFCPNVIGIVFKVASLAPHYSKSIKKSRFFNGHRSRFETVPNLTSRSSPRPARHLEHTRGGSKARAGRGRGDRSLDLEGVNKEGP